MVRFPRFDEWISGATQPTIRQLERFASTTHTPVGYLFLDKPPDEPLPLRDFRRRGTSVARTASADLLDTIYDCQRRQEWYRDFAVSTGAGEVPVVGALTIESDPVDGGRQLRDALAFPVGTRGSTWSETLSRLSEHAEQLGILVMISGVVGNNTHRVLDPQEFGGFALVDAIAPLVFVNGADTKAAQIFSLAHELAHVWLGAPGIDDADPSADGDQTVEQWCNAVAAELLVPEDLLRGRALGAVEPDDLDALAAEFRVSTLVVLRRLLDIGALDNASYWNRYEEESARLAEITASRPRASGGSFYATQPVRTSKRFTRALIADTLEGRTLYRDAFRLLGITKGDTFHELARRLDES